MNHKILLYSIIGLLGVSVMFFAITFSTATALQTTIPPISTTTTITNQIEQQNSFANVIINATQPDDTLTITTSGQINTTISGKTITMKIKSISCPILQGVKSVDSSGNFVCGVI